MKKNNNSQSASLGIQYARRVLFHTEINHSLTDAIKTGIAVMPPRREMPPGYNFRKVQVSIQDGSTRSVHLVAPQKLPPTTWNERIGATFTRRHLPNLKQGLRKSFEHQKPLLREKLNRMSVSGSMDSMSSILAPMAEVVIDGVDGVGSYIMRNQQFVQYVEGNPTEQFSSNVRSRNSYTNIDGQQVLSKKQLETSKNSSRCRCPLADESEENWQQRLWKKHQGPQICWEHKGIEDEEFVKYWLENKRALEATTPWNPHVLGLKEIGWVACIKNDKFTVWRKSVKGSNAFMYRVQASFKDVLPKDMFRVQTDLEFRKEWDEYITELRVLASDRRSKQELVHWVTSCPKPMLPREYVYKRRTMVDEGNQVMMVFNEATKDSANVPELRDIFRVNTYTSKLLLRSQHEDLDKEGVDFILTYHDDPESNVPSFIVSKLANHGISIMMERIQQLSKRLQKERRNEN